MVALSDFQETMVARWHLLVNRMSRKQMKHFSWCILELHSQLFHYDFIWWPNVVSMLFFFSTEKVLLSLVSYKSLFMQSFCLRSFPFPWQFIYHNHITEEYVELYLPNKIENFLYDCSVKTGCTWVCSKKNYFSLTYLKLEHNQVFGSGNTCIAIPPLKKIPFPDQISFNMSIVCYWTRI